jgi:uncharacterized protein (TIGR02271 family)
MNGNSEGGYFMETPMTQYQFRAGDDVIAADGDKVGSLADIQGNYLVVEKGFFFPRDYYIPFNTVANYDPGDGKIYLSVTKDAALNSGWDHKPDLTNDTYATGTTAAAGAYAGDTTREAFETDRAAAGASGVTGGMYGNDVTETTRDMATGRSTDARDQDHIRVPVHEEELIATKTPRQAGQVRVSKDVVEEERQIDVPVTEERVRVTRRAVDQAADTGDVAFKEESFEVPVRTEDVGVDKVVRVAEEVDIDKEAVRDTKRVSGTVRNERVNVDETGTDDSIYADTGRIDDTAST